MRAAISEAICIDSLLPVLRHLLGVCEAQKGLLEGSNSSLAMREVRVSSCSCTPSQSMYCICYVARVAQCLSFS
jgi:hypothetical protein